MSDIVIVRRNIALDRKFEWKTKADDSGTFEGYASTFGNEDTYGDTIMPGAFKASLAQHKKDGSNVKMLWQHQRSSPIGIFPITSMAEDSKGLHVKGEFTKGVKQSDETHALMKHGAIDSMSIGGYVTKELYDNKTGKSELHEIDLQEISPVTFPANKEARISTVKSIEQFGIMSELEAHLRDVGGFSAKEAKAIIAKARGFGSEVRDVPTEAAQLLKQAIRNLTITR